MCSIVSEKACLKIGILLKHLDKGEIELEINQFTVIWGTKALLTKRSFN